MYLIEKNINKIENSSMTYFLDPKELALIKGKLKKDEYKTYYPYKDSEKVILYRKELPEIYLYEIKCNIDLRHQDILGAMYSLNIDSSLFGDILLINNRYFIYILPIVENYFISNFLMVRNASVKLEKLDIDYLKDYKRSYERIELIVSSNRIDTVISSICHVGRNNINNMIKKKEVLLNYDYLKDASYKLKDGDVFSIKRIGKFKYNGVLKNTRKNHLVIEILKYL